MEILKQDFISGKIIQGSYYRSIRMRNIRFRSIEIVFTLLVFFFQPFAASNFHETNGNVVGGFQVGIRSLSKIRRCYYNTRASMLSFRPFEEEDRMSNRFVHKTIPFFVNTRSHQLSCAETI